MSPSSSTQQPHGVKRKKPPTFQHLPAQRAKKLKQSWVEVQKIKSKWKAQKRKEGLVAPRTQFTLAEDADEDRHVRKPHEHGDGEEGESSFPHASERGEGVEDNEGVSGDDSEPESEESSSNDEEPPQAATSSKVKRQEGGSNKNTDERQQPSLRDLQRMAYSKSSLHTHKSDPPHRQRGGALSGGRSGGRGGRDGHGGRGGRGGRGGQRGRGRGRGQPDMGLRMKAMLEKIKQDYT